jgi:NADH-quinone oxidoreductase B subunit
MNSPDMTRDIASEDLSIANPAAYPEVTQQLSENVIFTTVDDLYNWAKMSSLYPLMFGTACCFIEFSAMLASRFDLDRLGVFPRMSPRQADLMITAGTITMKYAPVLVRLYEQMPEPKYVIAMGACTITGGMFSADSPTVVRRARQANSGGCLFTWMSAAAGSDYGCDRQTPQENCQRQLARKAKDGTNPPLLHPPSPDERCAANSRRKIPGNPSGAA